MSVGLFMFYFILVLADGWLWVCRAVHINGMTVHDEPHLPHGGRKDSGFGRFGGSYGLDEFLTTKTVTFVA